MGVNSLPETVTRQRRGCDLNPGPTAPESSTLTTRLRATVSVLNMAVKCAAVELGARVKQADGAQHCLVNICRTRLEKG